MERDILITSDEEVVLQDSDVEEPETKVVQSEIEPEELEEEVDLPEIEVDEWIDVEDRWEKDYCFVVFTDEELYQYLYALYYPVLKDERSAQRMALLQKRILKQVIHSLQSQQTTVPPVNIIPILNGQRTQTVPSLGTYLKHHRSSKSYLLSQMLLDTLYPTVFDIVKEEPYYTPASRIEFQIVSELLEEPPKKKKAKHSKKKKTEDEDVPPLLKIINDTYIALSKETQPLPVTAVYKKPFYDEQHLDSLYLHERVSWKNASIDESEFFPLKEETEEGTKPIVKQSKLLSHLNDLSKYSFDDLITSMTTMPSFHDLTVLLSSYGFNIHTLTQDQVQLLDHHLNHLRSKEKKSSKTSTVRFSWTYKPVSNVLPSEFMVWSPLKEWIEQSMQHFEKVKEELEDQLRIIESNNQVFSKNPSMPMDIYDIAMKMKNDHLELEDVIQTLQSLYKEAQLSDYTQFIKAYIEGEWDIESIERKIQECRRLNDSIIPERMPILETYDYSLEVLKGKRSFMLEDMHLDDRVDGVDQEERVEETTGDDMTFEEIIPIIPFEDETSQTLLQSLPTRITHGQKEICMYVLKVLTVLQRTVDLPLNVPVCIEHLLRNIDRKSQYESLCEKLPEIPPEDLKSVFEQQTMFLALADAELEEKFKVAYKEVVKEYRKSILDAIFYALTWWVIVLQESYIQNPQSLQPGFLPCMPVWAFYGTPMSSSDEKGIARYIVCAIDYLRKQDEDSTLWKMFDSYSETQLLDKIYKMSKHDDFVVQVANLKQEWKDRWKEVAKKEKESDIRLETLEKSTHKTPQEYLSLYVELMKRLPTLLSQKEFEKRHSVVVPLANSCCLQPLNVHFQPYLDIKETPLYEKRSVFFAKSNTKQVTFTLGKVTIDPPPKPMPLESTGECLPETMVLPERPALDTIDDKKHTISIRQWNMVCTWIGKLEWKLPVLSDNDNEPITHLSSSHIQRAIRDLSFYIEKKVSVGKKQIDSWKTFMETQSWFKKLNLLNPILQMYYKEKESFKTLEWIEPITDRCIERVQTIYKEMSMWMLNEDTREGISYLMDYILLLAIIMPSIPSDDYKTTSLRWEGFDLGGIDQKWLQEIIDSRFSNISLSLKLQYTPSHKEIQDYYATMREHLKEKSLSEYKSKSIEEIQEIQEAKRLKLDKVAKPSTQPMDLEEILKPVQTDVDVEIEGENEFRRPTENPDDMNENQLD